MGDLWEGVDMVTQQLTSIGYGGASVRGNDQKLFHAVNGLASQMGPNNIPGWLVDFASELFIAASKPILDDIRSENDKVFIQGNKGNRLTEVANEVIGRYGKVYSETAYKSISDASKDEIIEFVGEQLKEERKMRWKQLIKGVLLLIFGAITFFFVV